MRQLEAFRATIALIHEVDTESVTYLPITMRPEHLRDMLRRVEEAGDTMSPAKLGRWLGWAQASVVAMRYATLDDMKALNKSFADDA